MTPIRQWTTRMRHGWVHMFTTHRPTLTLQLHNFDLSRTCRTALLRGNWQDFNWHDASRGPSAIAELLVMAYMSRPPWFWKFQVVKANRFKRLRLHYTEAISVEIDPSVAKILAYIAIYRFYVVGCCNLGFVKILNFNVRSAVGAPILHHRVKFV